MCIQVGNRDGEGGGGVSVGKLPTIGEFSVYTFGL